MKSSEFHKFVKKNGWEVVRVSGSHYVYEKNGVRVPVPYHASKEIGHGLMRKLMKQMNLK